MQQISCYREEEIPLTSDGFLFDLLGLQQVEQSRTNQLCNKALKATFSLKSKILDFDFSSMKLKLFDTLIKPIVTYAYTHLKFGYVISL
jgi:hypothetical protein